jgi:hypothetical protein
MKFKIVLSKNWKRMKRAKFQDVVDSIWEQMDDLSHDLSDAILVAPRRASARQVLLALKRIRESA